MNDAENRYQPPVIEEPTADATRLTNEEWRYAAKVFVIATLGASLFRGAAVTLQTIYALKAFNAESHVAGIVAVSSIRDGGGVNALFGVCLALILVVRRRTKADVPPPRYGLFWPIFLLIPVCASLSGLVMCGVCVAIRLLSGQVWSIIWGSIAKTFVLSDALIGMLVAAASSIVYAVFGAELARRIAKMHEWPILTYIAAWFVTGWTFELLGYPVMLVVFREELGPIF